MNVEVPGPVRNTVRCLQRNGFQAYVVGGAVRDLFLRRPPRDWDIGTDAGPDRVERLFRKTLPLGREFGTITVLIGKMQVQVTTFRAESDYRDRRRPSKVSFHGRLEADLSRRDFTINAMAFDPASRRFIDPFGGRADLSKGILRTVGDARERLSEDTLRLVRAGRFLSELEMRPDPRLTKAALAESRGVSSLSAERVRDELSKLLVGAHPSRGLRWLERTGVLAGILPELMPLRGFRQGGWHRHDVFVHTLRSTDASPPELSLRMALLLHDIAKPMTRTRDTTGYHFFGHERVGARMAGGILRRLRYPNDFIEEVCTLVEHHLFDVDPIARNDAAIRRLIRRVGEEKIERLMDLREADIRGCGPLRRPSRSFGELRRRIRRILTEKPPLQIKDLVVDGSDVMKWMRLPPGPEVGIVLRKLLQQVLDDPALNRRQKLKARMTKALLTVND